MKNYKLELFGHYEKPYEELVENGNYDISHTDMEYDDYFINCTEEELNELVDFLEYAVNHDQYEYYTKEGYEETFEYHGISWGNDSVYVALYPVLTGYTITENGEIVESNITKEYTLDEVYGDLVIKGYCIPETVEDLTLEKKEELINELIYHIESDEFRNNDDVISDIRWVNEFISLNNEEFINSYINFIHYLEERNDVSEWHIPQGWE